MGKYNDSETLGCTQAAHEGKHGHGTAQSASLLRNRTTAMDQPTPDLARSSEIWLLTRQRHIVAGIVTKPTSLPETS